jgi:sugar-specific transcriptional regulator TrmB
MEAVNILKELGLAEQEAKTYLTLLKIGGAIPSEIAREMGIKRTTIYPILKSLAAKGVAAVYFRANKRFYYPIKPDKLTSMFEKRLEMFNGLIPSLELAAKAKTQTLGLRFIETQEELKHFYLEILEEYKTYKTKEYYIIGSTSEWEGIDQKFFVQYRKDRAALHIKTKLLLSYDSREKNPSEESLLREYKYLPEKYHFKSTIDIFKDKILIVSSDLSSLAVVIAVPAMVDVFKSVFEIIWDTTNTIQ